MTVTPSKETSDRFDPTPSYALDGAVKTLSSRVNAWVEVPIADKIEYLRSVARRTIAAAPALVADSVTAKGIPEKFAGEEWVAGPVSVLRTVRFLIHTLEGIRRTGRVPIPDRAIRERHDGQVVVDVLPADRWDRLLYRGWEAQVWMDPEIVRRDARRHMGGLHTKPDTVRPGVGLVLGAGNVSSIVPLDIVHKLYVDGEVALAKFSPVNDYIGPHIENAFADLIADGFVRTAYGGASVGEQLVQHPQISSVHITGGADTHDRIVFGPGSEGAARKARSEPLIDKPITSELGNVSPVIVVPGQWKPREVRYHAEHVATQMLQNNGFNCNAAKVLIVHNAWPQRGTFLDELRRVLRSRPERPAYYPGAVERFESVISQYPDAEVLGSPSAGIVPPTLLVGVDPDSDSVAFREEAFCSVMAVTELPGGGPAEFLERAVLFCNEQLAGTLNATIIVDADTEKSLGPAVEDAVAGLHYGSVSVNMWAAAAFPLGVTTWGAYPGHSLADVGSGIGFVHNARLIDRPQKAVVRTPFFLFPKPAFSITHRRAALTLRRVAAFEAAPSLGKLPGILASAVRQ